MGHSRGGDGAVQTEVFNQSMNLGLNIKAVVALAPTDFSGTHPTVSQRLKLQTSRFLCVYGANDGDVSGGYPPALDYTGSGFRFYDRSTVEKAMAFIYGATHNRFNTEWGTESGVDTGSPKIVSAADHRTLLAGYMTAFMQYCLKNRPEQVAYFTGQLDMPNVAAGVEVHHQYAHPNRRMLDDFETQTAITTNSLGGSVAANGLNGSPVENTANALDDKAPHQTRAVRVRWQAQSGTYRSTIPTPAANRNVSGYDFLSFRVTQTVDSNDNPANQDQNFKVWLHTAGNGPERAIHVSRFQEVPFPYTPAYPGVSTITEEQNTKAAFKTVRIPLDAWTIKCMSAPIVNLTNVEAVTFEFTNKPTGEILIDDVAFTS
jgi:hypothetical protein